MSDQPAVTAGGWCAPSETIYDLATGGSREQALWAGLAEPTPEERQAAADRLYEQETRDNAAWFDTGVMLEQIKHHEFTGLAAEIMRLHNLTPMGPRSTEVTCRHCAGWDDSFVTVEWPCATVRVVLADAGIKVPDELVYDKPDPVVQDAANPRWPYPAGPVDTRLTLPEVSVTRGGLAFGMQP